jgi:four helix bundle protein
MKATKKQTNKVYREYKARKAPFERLWIWQEAHRLMLEIHQICNKMPFSERLLKDQIKRSSSSVSDNIAESYGDFYYKNKLKAFYIARKEARETQNHIKSMGDKGFLEQKNERELVSRYERVVIGINNFIKHLIKKQSNEKDEK